MSTNTPRSPATGNPLHFDSEFAGKTKFRRLVVHGGVTSGLLNALVAEDMPGPGTVFMSMDLTFTAPVYVGDTITATAEVLEVHERKPIDFGLAKALEPASGMSPGMSQAPTITTPATTTT